MSTSKRHELVVGSHVKFMLGGHRVDGVVVEDRGRIGVGGRQLVRVVVPQRDTELELPADELKFATA